jgi:hypothetical protein
MLSKLIQALSALIKWLFIRTKPSHPYRSPEDQGKSRGYRVP